MIMNLFSCCIPNDQTAWTTCKQFAWSIASCLRLHVHATRYQNFSDVIVQGHVSCQSCMGTSRSLQVFARSVLEWSWPCCCSGLPAFEFWTHLDHTFITASEATCSYALTDWQLLLPKLILEAAFASWLGQEKHADGGEHCGKCYLLACEGPFPPNACWHDLGALALATEGIHDIALFMQGADKALENWSLQFWQIFHCNAIVKYQHMKKI